jgi:hypothetical protein
MGEWKEWRERQRELAGTFFPGQTVKVICDHDGPRGKWVGVKAMVVRFVWDNPTFPWLIKAASGSTMYCAAEMLAPDPT